jgi:PAS domain S-box-containing protein
MSLDTSTRLPAEYETLHTGIALYNAATARIVAANERLESLFGYPTQELRRLSIKRYTANTYKFSEPDFVRRLQAASDGDPQQFLWRIKRSDGELVWVRVHLAQQTVDGREYVLAEIRDITDHYTASRREMLFWRILRHNLRNETTTIAGRAGEIKTLTDSDDVTAAAETIRATAMELGGVATSVKEIQQAVLQSETNRSHRQAAAAIRDVVSDIEREYPDAEVTVEERERMWIHVDSAFDHALSHAIENAIVHSEQDRPTVTVAVRASPNTGRVEIRITDTNPVIPDAEVDALDEFADLTSTYHGTGVGLFVMKWCIESLGGELEFEERDPRGNVVRLYLPPKSPSGPH